ncbi:uncharacterized protein LOC121871451 isoform X2 [Homarus americanus]|uniref:uncharacterized protein LOC121871451 isoform X2 n=1 Tax=Homarus americanus TaxID=6706 RepID=UPI001C448921|nr:uncharacterized protein LOC121871451 isoform X2 [Homarus americanus]
MPKPTFNTMGPVSRGPTHASCVLRGWRSSLILLLLVPAGITAASVSPKTRTFIVTDSTNEIESFVKKLEYEAANGVEYTVDGVVVPVDLNLLPDDIIAEDIQDGLEEEFTTVDKELGDNTTETVNATTNAAQSRQLSLIFQGVYAPDARFNAFADGVMVNMVAEMKRKQMDPLYFRVYNRGIVEHVATRAGRDGRRDEPAATSSNFRNTGTRRGRQQGNAIGGGVVRGLTNVKRFGNAEVQIAGNLTLIRAHWLTGPLDLIIDYRASPGITRVRTGLQAVQLDTLTVIDRFGAEMSDFHIVSPAEYEIRLVGAQNERYQRISQSALLRLFKPTGRLERRLRGVYVRSRSRRIPDVVARSQRRNRNRNRNKQKGSSSTNTEETTTNGQDGGNGNSERSNDQGSAQTENSQVSVKEPELP